MSFYEKIDVVEALVRAGDLLETEDLPEERRHAADLVTEILDDCFDAVSNDRPFAYERSVAALTLAAFVTLNFNRAESIHGEASETLRAMSFGSLPSTDPNSIEGEVA